jgi:hypothetical protein
MKSSNQQELPAPPRLISAFVAGFDAVTKHIALILFPIILDLFLWFGPHVRISQVIGGVIEEVRSTQGLESPELAELMVSYLDIWRLLGERINLLIGLRSFPVGIPSLMVSILPVRVPAGTPPIIEVNSGSLALILFIIFVILGLGLGSLFFALVSQAALDDHLNISAVVASWPRTCLNIILLSLVWVIILIGLSIPASCLISLSVFGGITASRIVLLLVGSVMLWILFPLLFSPHGIFINEQSFFDSIKAGVRLTNMTLPTTGLFFLILILISQGLDTLWRIPTEDSWIAIIGITGHAFVATGLVASSFIYYRDADRWIKGLKARLISSTP